MTRLMRALLKQGLLTKRVHKVRMLDQTITQGTDTLANLLTCDDDPNYDLTTDGSNVSECHPGAMIVAVQLVLTLFSVPDGETIEWVIGRDPDGAIGTGFTMADLYTSDVTASNALLKKNVWGAGHMVSSDGHAAMNTSLNITKALRRAAKMRDGDAIKIRFTATAASGNSAFYMRGRIITVGP